MSSASRGIRVAIGGVLLAAVVLAGWLPAGSVSAQAAFCAEGEEPSFSDDFAELAARLGAIVGDPVECEHVSAENGDVLQATSEGLAIYRTVNGMAVFTNGGEHWALAEAGLLYWIGGSVDPPSSAWLADPETLRLPANGGRVLLDVVARVLPPAPQGQCLDLEAGTLTTTIYLVGETVGEDKPVRFLFFSNCGFDRSAAIEVVATRTPALFSTELAGGMYCYTLTNEAPLPQDAGLDVQAELSQDVVVRLSHLLATEP